MNTHPVLKPLALGASLALTANTHAAPVTKAAAGTDLSDGLSWEGTAPGAGDVATWTGASLGAGLSLGSNAQWQGIKVIGAASNIAITGAGNLTLGTDGIHLAGVDLAIDNAISLVGGQTWSAASGRLLTVSGPITGSDPIHFGVAAQSLTSTTFLTTAPQTIFSNASLAGVTNTSGKMGGQ
jgi:hypothetical protein